MISHNMGQSLGKLCMSRMKGKERHNCSGEILSVISLDFIPSFGIGHFSFCEALSGSLRFELGSNSCNCRSRRPHASREYLATLLLLHYPMIASSFHSSGQSSIAWLKECPVSRCGNDFAIGSAYRGWSWTWTVDEIAHSASP
jgi:hypothetical protein